MSVSDSLLVFDMDGVLVDVSESYRETIQRTVEHFTGEKITRDKIQDWKNQGGWNDDWVLSNHLIGLAGVKVRSETGNPEGYSSTSLHIRINSCAEPEALKSIAGPGAESRKSKFTVTESEPGGTSR